MTMRADMVIVPATKNMGRRPVLSTKNMTIKVPVQRRTLLIMVAVKGSKTPMLLMKIVP